jgi:hypothetical protein
MTKDDWVIVGEYSNSASARVAAGLLKGHGTASRLWPNPQPTVGADMAGDFYIWVAPAVAHEARRILAIPKVSEEELTRQALNEPPPDDA